MYNVFTSQLGRNSKGGNKVKYEKAEIHSWLLSKVTINMHSHNKYLSVVLSSLQANICIIGLTDREWLILDSEKRKNNQLQNPS